MSTGYTPRRHSSAWRSLPLFGYTKYKHRPLQIKENEIRLLQLDYCSDAVHGGYFNSNVGSQNEVLHCSLIHHPLRTAPPYVALSYTWGTSTVNHILHIGKSVFPISGNLHEALKHLYLRGKCKHIWVDAICINQKDNDEKSRQILRLRPVFRKAEVVIAWLGLHDEFSRIVFHYLQDESGRRKGSIADTDPLLKVAIRAFVARPYWYRTWVVQEFAVATELQIRCSEDQVSVDELKHLMEAYDALCNCPGLFVLEPIQSLMTIRELQEEGHHLNLLEVRELTRRFEHEDNPSTWKASGTLFQSTHILDQVYGLLGLAADADVFVIESDYTFQANTLLVEMIQSAIRTKRTLDFILLENDPRLLCAMNFGSKYGANYDPLVMPSWCPDFLRMHRSTQNSEVRNAIYPAGMNPYALRGCKHRFGKVQSHWWATTGPLKSDEYRFEGFRALSVRGKQLGTIVKSGNQLSYLAARNLGFDQRMLLEELLCTYCDVEPDQNMSLQQIVYAVSKVLQGQICGCNGKVGLCQKARQAVVSIINARQHEEDLLPDLLRYITASTSIEQSTRTAPASTSSKHYKLACSIVWSLYANYTLFKRKLVAYASSEPYVSVPRTGTSACCLGWVPQSAIQGDKIWLLPSCSMPLVLRVLRGSCRNAGFDPPHVKVGPAVIVGAMSGDMWTETGFKSWVTMV